MNQNTKVNPVATGENYGELAVYAGIAVVITGLLVAAMWYGYYYYPLNTVLGGEEASPLREQVPLDIMPALPVELQMSYDEHTDEAIERISSYGVADEDAGTVRIPISEAQALLLDEGFAVYQASEDDAEASDD